MRTGSNSQIPSEATSAGGQSAAPTPALKIEVSSASPAGARSDLSAILDAVAWPLAFLIVALLFRQQIVKLLSGQRQFEFEVLGQKVRVGPDEARNLLEDVVGEMFTGMTEREKVLLEEIIRSNGQKTVGELIPDFKRDALDHMMLRALRGRQLIRPLEEGTWKAGSHPVKTQFLTGVLRANPEAVPRPATNAKSP